MRSKLNKTPYAVKKKNFLYNVCRSKHECINNSNYATCETRNPGISYMYVYVMLRIYILSYFVSSQDT